MKHHQPKALKLLLATAAKQSESSHQCLLNTDCASQPLPVESKRKNVLTRDQEFEIEQREKSGPARRWIRITHPKWPMPSDAIREKDDGTWYTPQDPEPMWEPDSRDNAVEIQFPEPQDIEERINNLRDHS